KHEVVGRSVERGPEDPSAREAHRQRPSQQAGIHRRAFPGAFSRHHIQYSGAGYSRLLVAMMRSFLALALLPHWPALAGSAADVARAVRDGEFDPAECYRVRDLTLAKEDIRIYFTDGYLIFSRPVAGRPIAAVFSAENDGGDGEVLLMPPDRAERKSLATYIHSPNMDEHFRTVLLLFTGSQHE